MKTLLAVLTVLFLVGCGEVEEGSPDFVDLAEGRDISKVQVYAANSGTDPIHIFPKGLDRFSPSNRVNPGSKQVAMGVLVTIPEGKNSVMQRFVAGRDGVEIYSETCEVAAKQRTIVEYTGSALACKYELKPGAEYEADPESGTGTTG